jgi:hypothetical protein
MEDIKRYTCQQCGIMVRVDGDQDYRACACNAEWTIEVEDEPAPPPADPPSEE